MSTAIESTDQTATADTTPAEITPWAPGDSIKVITASEGYELLLANPHALFVGETITDNTRQTVVEDDTFDDDVKEFGVDVVIEARRDEEGVIRVHDGKMRTLAARKAGMDEVLVLVRPNDNDDERDATVKRIFSQLRINERRSDISNADKLAALHQLVLLNVTAKEIASQRHMPLKEAKKLH
ncbi:hypothetical protein [Lentzea flaviverrucosa]|uniref:Chromosome partitioning protein, ParB family n=1 Tax=Lentzea flaviverrucosa TaxID=200379 RepID=A0A1H9EJU8_9PSEU|nr:hypothetical protein [Lentzea flaviverrucosa]RDI35461.1 hypothetical protein DFR72_1011212 [Lentzea flaviverrucosa]SEQ26036.1 hypothetical protein SAMN05216195_1025 [Lentzea flaviverrucosa]